MDRQRCGAMSPPSLCISCAHVRVVTGRHGQTYLLCRNSQILEKYPRQPVIMCCGYTAGAVRAQPLKPD
jgi:hypothetical protein